MSRRFAAADEPWRALRARSYEVITGFGPTNAPIAGTLSVMIGIVELQEGLGASTTVVISDLGAWNSRNIAWDDLCCYRERMTRFLVTLGFDTARGTIRTHLDVGNLVRSGRIARYLGLKDFDRHQEEFLELYGSHGLLGSGTGLMVDALYTVADILQPIEQGRDAVLVVSGLEESYFTKLARLVIQHQQREMPTLSWAGEIGALYFRVVRGLAGYPKMSKSILASAIHLGLTETELERRVLSTSDSDQAAVLDAIDLASGWPGADRAEARATFAALPTSANAWMKLKQRYLETFRGFAQLWHRTAG